MNSLKLFCGQGWLAAPFVFSQAGWLGGCLLFAAVGIVNGYTMILNLRLAESHRLCRSYSEIAQRIFGSWGKKIVDVNICLALFSFCAGYLYFIGNTTETIVCHYSGGRDLAGNLTGEGYCDHAALYIILVTIPILPICWIETFTFLSYFTSLGSIAAVLSIALMVGYMWKIADKGGVAEGEMKVFDFSQVVANFGIAVFLFEGNATVVNIWAECKN